MLKPQTLKGFRDFLPKEAKKRQYVINILKQVFESYGFEPLETPALETLELLKGKYGEEEKLIYSFKTRGEREVALRYDQTVPLARIISQYPELPKPFKRYQIQNVWRGERPQKGRYREFLQCDADIVGSSSPLSDVETIIVAAKSLEKLGFKSFKIKINDREIFSKLSEQGFLSKEDLPKALRSLDKVQKIGEKGVTDDLQKNGFSKEIAEAIISNAGKLKQNPRSLEVFSLLSKMGIPSEKCIFYPTLARGLDYYTGMIFEIEIDGYSAGSVCGGGRYDNLIGMFSGKNIPAVGFSFGFDRLMETMEELDLFPKDLQTTKVLVTVFPASPARLSTELSGKSTEIADLLREKGINTELWLEADTKMEKQLKYADKKQIPYAVIIGPDEVSKNQVTLRNMNTRQQKTLPQEEIIKILSS